MKLFCYVLRVYSGEFALVIEDGHCGGVGGDMNAGSSLDT